MLLVVCLTFWIILSMTCTTGMCGGGSERPYTFKMAARLPATLYGRYWRRACVCRCSHGHCPQLKRLIGHSWHYLSILLPHSSRLILSLEPHQPGSQELRQEEILRRGESSYHFWAGFAGSTGSPISSSLEENDSRRAMPSVRVE